MLKPGTSRNQLEFVCLDNAVSEDSTVRVIDLFVDGLELKSLGFIIKGSSLRGRSAFSSKSLLKLYLYGYIHRTRSSRQLEALAKTNIEVMWLLESLKPGYKTIADFRKDNKEAFTLVFEALTIQLKKWDLLNSSVVAQDGTKLRAQNSRKNNYNAKKLSMLLRRIETNMEGYLAELSENDQLESAEISEIEKKLESLSERKVKYKALESELAKSDQNQISTVDADARLYKERRKTAHVAYNSQIIVDEQNKFILAQQVSNLQDEAHLDEMTAKAQEVLDEKEITVLADKKYDVAQELAKVQKRKVKTLVAAKKARKDQKLEGFRAIDFYYDEKKDLYICPNKKQLHRVGDIYDKKREGKLSYRYYKYHPQKEDCIACPFRDSCLSKSLIEKNQPREIQRHEFQAARDKNLANLKEAPDLYKRRKALVEHPFGTIKRQWGYDYTLLKGLEGVRAEFSMISTCYNLRRAITILGAKELISLLKEYLKQIKAFITTIRCSYQPHRLAA